MVVVNCYILWREQAKKKNSKIRWNLNDFSNALVRSILTACDERPVEKSRYVIPRKVAGGLQIGISKVVAEVIDLEAVNFARGHHFAKNEEVSQKTGEIKCKCCVLCRELGFKLGRDVELYLKETNINSQSR